MVEDMPEKPYTEEEINTSEQKPRRRAPVMPRPARPRFNRGYRLASQYKLKNYLNLADLITKRNDHARRGMLNSLNDFLDNYNSFVNIYSTPQDDRSGNGYEPLTASAVKTLQRNLKYAYHVTDVFLQNTTSKDALYSTMQKMQKIIGDEHKLYNKYNPNSNIQTLPEFLQEAKGKSLVLPPNSNNIEKLGGCMNSRKLLKFNEGGQTRKGLFTERTTFDYEKSFEHNLAAWKRQWDAQLYTEEQINADVQQFQDPTVRASKADDMRKGVADVVEFKRFFDVMESARQSYDPSMSPADFYLKAFTTKKRARGSSFSIRVNDGMPPQIGEYIKKSDDDNNFLFKVFYEGDFAECLGREANKIRQYRRIHDMKLGDRIDSRSSAMSAVASLFGQDHLLAKSESMNVKYPNGRVVKGTFMDFSSGVDINHTDVTDPYVTTQGEIIEGGRGLKSVADLGVLDYICGNTDRHEANMLYRFDNDGKFSGVVGIDNDLSFGKTRNGAREYGGNAADLQVISEEMADAISQTTPEAMRLALSGYGLSRQDLDCAVERMTKIKNMIAQKEGEPALRVVRDNEWDGIKLQDLNKDKKYVAEYEAENPDKPLQERERKVESIFLSASLANNILKDKRENLAPKRAKLDENAHAKSDDHNFTETTVGRDAATESYDALSHKMRGLLDELKTANKGFFIGSKEYDNMLSYATYMNEELHKMANDPKLSYEVCYSEQFNKLDNENNHQADQSKQLSKEQIEKLAAEKANEMVSEKEQEYFERAQSMFGTMRDVTGMYIQHRKSDNKLQTSETARTRTLAATDLYSFVDSNCKKFSVTPEELYRKGMARERQSLIGRQLSSYIGKSSAKNLGIKGDEIYNPEMKKEREAVFGQMNAKNIRDKIKELRSIKDPAQRAAQEKQLRQYLNERKEDAIKSHLVKEAAKTDKQKMEKQSKKKKEVMAIH